jgi:hypothetical protein
MSDKPEIQEFREKLAALCHSQWSGWMEYLFGQSQKSPHTSIVCIPPYSVVRWERQMQTPYTVFVEKWK